MAMLSSDEALCGEVDVWATQTIRLAIVSTFLYLRKDPPVGDVLNVMAKVSVAEIWEWVDKGFEFDVDTVSRVNAFIACVITHCGKMINEASLKGQKGEKS